MLLIVCCVITLLHQKRKQEEEELARKQFKEEMARRELGSQNIAHHNIEVVEDPEFERVHNGRGSLDQIQSSQVNLMGRSSAKFDVSTSKFFANDGVRSPLVNPIPGDAVPINSNPSINKVFKKDIPPIIARENLTSAGNNSGLLTPHSAPGVPQPLPLTTTVGGVGVFTRAKRSKD